MRKQSVWTQKKVDLFFQKNVSLLNDARS